MAGQWGHVVDSHQHVWRVSARSYDWITHDLSSLNRDFIMSEVREDIVASGVTATVLVQAADTYEDTFYMLSVAARYPGVRGIVGWVPLNRTAEAVAALEAYRLVPLIKGIRNLTHDYADPLWILRPACVATLREMARLGFSLDMVSTCPSHTEAIVQIATAIPGLSIVLNHLGTPPVLKGDRTVWRRAIGRLSRFPNVSCKISGLATLSKPGWVASDWQPFVDFCIESFGTQRLMLGSDWPVSTLAGDYRGVWAALNRVISRIPPERRDDVRWKSANNIYRLELPLSP